MCIKPEKVPPKKYISSKFSENVLIYSREVGKNDPDRLFIDNDEMAFIICFDGSKQRIMESGFYRIIEKPTRVIWIKKVPREVKIGVPREATGVNIGFHTRIRLYPINWNVIYESFEFEGREKTITLDEIKEILRESALGAFMAVAKEIENPSNNLEEVKRKFNEELNKILVNTKLSGFAAIVSHLGFSTMCKLPQDIFEVAKV